MSVVAQNEAFHKYVKPFFTHASLCNLKGKIQKMVIIISARCFT